VIADRLAESLDNQLADVASAISELDEDLRPEALTGGAVSTTGPSSTTGATPATAPSPEAVPLDLMLDAFEVAVDAMLDGRGDVLAAVRQQPAGNPSTDADDEAELDP
jgi:hypothetical protein